MSHFASAEVPFVKLGNRRALTADQLAENPELADFVTLFSHCFEYDPLGEMYVFLEN